MALQRITLEAAAGIFRVHPRTICRALTGEHNTYWTEDINHDLLSLSDIAGAYGMDVAALRRCVERRDSLLKAVEAADIMDMRPRTFRKHVMRTATRGRKNGTSSTAQYTKLGKVGSGGVVRYLESKIRAASIAHSE